MTLETTQPAAQLFTGKPGAIALETQHFADAPNHPNFPSTVLRPGETFRSTTVYTFSACA
jgi:aldose 1-epimerase